MNNLTPRLVRALWGIVVLSGASGLNAATPAPITAPRPAIAGRALPPPVTAASTAYDFRTRLLVTPSCQSYIAAADAAFLDDLTDIPVKAALLQKLEAEATAANCLAPR